MKNHVFTNILIVLNFKLVCPYYTIPYLSNFRSHIIELKRSNYEVSYFGSYFKNENHSASHESLHMFSFRKYKYSIYESYNFKHMRTCSWDLLITKSLVKMRQSEDNMEISWQRSLFACQPAFNNLNNSNNNHKKNRARIWGRLPFLGQHQDLFIR